MKHSIATVMVSVALNLLLVTYLFSVCGASTTFCSLKYVKSSCQIYFYFHRQVFLPANVVTLSRQCCRVPDSELLVFFSIRREMEDCQLWIKTEDEVTIEQTALSGSSFVSSTTTIGTNNNLYGYSNNFLKICSVIFYRPVPVSSVGIKVWIQIHLFWFWVQKFDQFTVDSDPKTFTPLLPVPVHYQF